MQVASSLQYGSEKGGIKRQHNPSKLNQFAVQSIAENNEKNSIF
jgi:hypothetical protein